MLTFKNKRETERDHPHIDVYFGSAFVGYITSPKVNKVCGLWHFTKAKDYYIRSTEAKTENLLIEKIKNQLK